MNRVSGLKPWLWISAALVSVLGVAPSAFAQISRGGNIEILATTNDLNIGAVKGVDVAYDPVNNQYLVINAYGPVDGFFTDDNGVRQQTFRIKPGGGKGGPIGEYPRVAYSPDVNGGKGGFLVVWPQEGGGLRTRVVAHPGTLVGDENTISGNTQPTTISGAAVAYSPTSKVFLVAWQSVAPDTRLRAAIVGLDGARIGEPIVLSSGYGRDPGVSWNSATDQFGVSFSAEDKSGGFSCFALVSTASPTTFANRECFNRISGLTFITDSNYNPSTGNYLMTWYEQVVGIGGRGMKQEFDAQGGRVGDMALIAKDFGSYDALTTAYNPISGTFAVAGVFGDDDNLAAAELAADGTRTSSRETVGAGARAHYTRITTNTEAAEWNIAFSGFGFNAVADQVIATSTRSGPTSNIQMAIDSPINGFMLGRNAVLTVTGWAIDRGAATGTGIDYIEVEAVPAAGGAPIPIGTVTSFTARNDLIGLLGSQFVNSGFSVSKSGLPTGAYTIRATPHSTVTNSFGPPRTVSITVNASLPLLSIDTPASDAHILGRVTVTGWVLDRFADSGTGINAVHVWAWPAGGGSPLFLAEATLGVDRPDVGAAFGSNQFDKSGYSATGYLPTGAYTLVVYGNDAYSNSFSVSAAKNITVRSGFMSVDTPVAGNVNLGSTIRGWAVDLGATSGVGMDQVHVWAFPTDGGPAQWVGWTNVNQQRLDVAGQLGSSQFNNCGFSLPLLNLQSGRSYYLVAFAHSTVTGRFDVSILVPITVN